MIDQEWKKILWIDFIKKITNNITRMERKKNEKNQ